MIYSQEIENSIVLTQQDRTFVNLINNRITMYGQIPYTVPEKLIIETIKESARFFYTYFWKSCETAYYRLQIKDINNFLTSQNPNFDVSNLVGAEITLPGWVNVVKEVYETNRPGGLNSQELVENIQSLNRVSPYGVSLMGINNNMFITEAVCKMVEEQAFQSITGTAVGFHYNPLTKRIRFHTQIKDNLILECLCMIDVQYLYLNDLFLRHVLARVKQELKRKLAGHTIPLPGEVALNAEEICNNIEDGDKVEDIIKASSGIGDIIMMRD